MSKKQKIVPVQTKFLGTIQKLTFQNFTLCNTTEINFNSDINIINYSSIPEKILLEFILNRSLNPYFLNQNRKISKDISELFNLVKLNSKQSIIYCVVLNLSSQKNFNLKSDVLTNFISDNEFQLEFEIDSNNNVLSRVFDYTNHQFSKITPSLEYSISEVLKKSIFLDESLFPYFNAETIHNITKYNHAQLFDFFLELINLHDLKLRHFKLKEDINLKELENDNFQIIKEQAVEKKLELEKELTIKKEIAELSEQIDNLEVEKSWAHYFDLKSKFESKSGSIEQVTTRLPNLEEEKEKLEQQIEDQTQKITELQTEAELLSNEYEQQRKEFLSEKASLDKIDRNLKNWDASVSKAERDLKFKTMKVKDKEKKLKDLEARIKASPSESLVTQKDKLEKELTKDQKEIKGLQESLDALKNEKNLKTKEKSVKEKNSQPKSVLLADLTNKISKVNDSLASKEEKLKQLKVKLEAIESSITKNEQEKESLDEEISKLSADLTSEMERLRKKKIEMPKENRSLSTITVLQNQLLNQRNSLSTKIHSTTSEKTYSNHLAFIDNLETESKTRSSQLAQLSELLEAWEDEWKKIFKTDLVYIQNEMKAFLSFFDLKSEIFQLQHINPNEGALGVYFSSTNQSSKGSISLNYTSVESTIVLISLIMSSVFVSNSHLYIFDLFEAFSYSINKIQEFITLFMTKLAELNSNAEKTHTQTIFFVHTNVIENFKELQQNFIIK